MSLKPDPIQPVPEETARIARAAFRKGNPLLTLRDERVQIAQLESAVGKRARTDPVVRRLMTAPGAVAVVALAFTSAIEDPTRFRRSS